MEDNNQRDQLDQMLDAALARYATVEPRTGLEERVLANLRAETARTARRPWFRWSGVAAVAAVVLAVTVIAWKAATAHHRPVARRPSIVAPGVPSSASQSAAEIATNPKPMPVPSSAQYRPHVVAVAAAPPKLNQFPSPQPLTEQEKILATYVARFHDQAVLVARLTNEELKRDRIEILGNSENANEVTDQQTTNR